MSSTSSVMATANTPSLNPISRLASSGSLPFAAIWPIPAHPQRSAYPYFSHSHPIVESGAIARIGRRVGRYHTQNEQVLGIERHSWDYSSQPDFRHFLRAHDPFAPRQMVGAALVPI